jgi:hypothetical protein
MANLRTNNLSGEQGQNAYRGSVFFNGGSDSLVIPASSDFAYGTGDFTIEAYIWKSARPATGQTRGIFTQTQSGNDYIVFKVGSTNVIEATFGSTTISTTGKLAVDSWNHVAVSRSSNTVKVFLNGIASSGSTVSTDFSDTTRNPTIGNYTHSYGTIPYFGFISNLRVTKGEALYTADFTPPTTELTADANTVLLCCQNSEDPTQEETGRTITANGSTSLVNRTDNLIKNGRFTASATENWTLSGGSAALGTGQSGTFGDGNHLVLTASSSYAYLYQAFTTVIGRTYRVNAQSNGGDASYISTTTDENDAIITDIRSSTQTTDGRAASKNFVATQTTYYVILRGTTGGGNFDSVSVYEQENRVPPKVIPPFGVDAGNTFGGPIQQSSQGYMYFPTGRTEERGRGRAVWGGGDSSPTPYETLIDFVQIQSGGIGLGFGDLSVGGNQIRGVSSFTRGIFGGGRRTPANTSTNIMDFVTIANTANAVDFGDLSNPKAAYAEISSSTRGIFAAGYDPSATNTIDFVTIATLGNASDFGDVTGGARYTPFGTQSTTRGIIAGGSNPALVGTYNAIDFLTIATTGNTSDFGDLTNSRHSGAATSNGVRGVFMAGGTPSLHNVIDFITIASTGNAIDFGDLGSMSNGQSTATSDKIRGVLGLGWNGSNYLNVIQQVTIATTGNSVDVGELTLLRHQAGCFGDAHGGLSE